MQANPYESPRECQPEKSDGGLFWIELRRTIAGAGMTLGAVMGLLGQIITFAPHAGPNWWFVYATLLAACGLVWPSWRGRGIAIVLLVWLGAEIYSSYWRGKAYEEWKRTQRVSLSVSSVDNN
jgi:hypothetical protein